jgi:hypothetical protein
MTQTSVAIPRKQNGKAVDLANHVAELVAVTNSIITNIQGQSDVNEALTKRLLSLEDRISQLESKMRVAAAPAPPPRACGAENSCG